MSKYKKVGVLPIQILNSNVSSVLALSFSPLWRRALRSKRSYRQYTNLFIFRFVSLLCHSLRHEIVSNLFPFLTSISKPAFRLFDLILSKTRFSSHITFISCCLHGKVIRWPTSSGLRSTLCVLINPPFTAAFHIPSQRLVRVTLVVWCVCPLNRVKFHIIPKMTSHKLSVVKFEELGSEFKGGDVKLSESYLPIQIRSPNNNGTIFVRRFYNVIPTTQWFESQKLIFAEVALTKIPHEHVPKSHVITCDQVWSHVTLEHVHVEFL